MSSESSSYDAFDSELHQGWKADRQLRRTVPLHEAWRGCLGLAMLLDRPDDTDAHGELALVKNDQVTWLALRDVPVGRCPGSPIMNRRDVNSATTAVAELRYGMPVIDFTKNVRVAVDFRFMPVGRHLSRVGPNPWDVRVCDPQPDTLNADHHAREFAVLNAVSAAMTRFAFCATGDRGPLRPAWHRRRAVGWEPCRPVSPAAWMPRPYLAFPLDAADRACDLAAGFPGLGHAGPSVRQRLRRALAGGLVLRATGAEVYCGPARKPGTSSGVLHRLRSVVDGRERVVTLPASARVSVAAGAVLEPGEAWAHVSGDRSRTSGSGNGQSSSMRRLAHLWLGAQAVRPTGDSGVVLFPAELVAAVARDLQPVGLWWDIDPALPHYHWEVQAAAFPPLPLRRWDWLRLTLPAEVALTADLADPRFATGRIGRRRAAEPTARPLARAGSGGHAAPRPRSSMSTTAPTLWLPAQAACLPTALAVAG